MRRDPLEVSVRVASWATDAGGRCTPGSLLRFMEDAGWRDAVRLGVGFSDMEEKGLLWGLILQRIRIFRYPVWGEALRVRTWHAKTEGICFLRAFEIFDANGERVLEAIGDNVVIDSKRRRCVRPDAHLLSEAATHVAMPDLPKVPLSPMPEAECEWPIRIVYRDLDGNDHVNHVRYLEWAMDSLGMDHLRHWELSGVTIAYKKEIRESECLKVVRSKMADGVVECAILKEGEVVACRLRMTWRKRDA